MIFVWFFWFFQEEKSGKIGKENKRTTDKNKSFAYFFSSGKVEQNNKGRERWTRKYKIKKPIEKADFVPVVEKKAGREKFVEQKDKRKRREIIKYGI